MDAEIVARMDAAGKQAHESLKDMRERWTDEQNMAVDSFIGWIANNTAAGYKRLLNPLMGSGRYKNFLG